MLGVELPAFLEGEWPHWGYLIGWRLRQPQSDRSDEVELGDTAHGLGFIFRAERMSAWIRVVASPIGVPNTAAVDEPPLEMSATDNLEFAFAQTY